MSQSPDIDKNIPIPLKSGRLSKWPLDRMDIGDSFLFDVIDRNNVAYATSLYKRKNLGTNFTKRRVSDTQYRIWRIA